MTALPLRLHPGQDLRAALQATLAEHGADAAFVLQGIGSLRPAHLRLAGAESTITLAGDTEILTLAGTLAPDGVHLHLTLSDTDGRVWGGHAGPGCIVRTTAEVLLMLLPAHQFRRLPDPATGYTELVVGPAAAAAPAEPPHAG
jgi:predicted DNA-binding protein with PD1-like motif